MKERKREQVNCCQFLLTYMYVYLCALFFLHVLYLLAEAKAIIFERERALNLFHIKATKLSLPRTLWKIFNSYKIQYYFGLIGTISTNNDNIEMKRNSYCFASFVVSLLFTQLSNDSSISHVELHYTKLCTSKSIIGMYSAKRLHSGIVYIFEMRCCSSHKLMI